MADASGTAGRDRAQAQAEGQAMDRATQARLAYRLQHLKTLRQSRQTKAYWEQDLAQRAREELARQRAAARATDEERARQRDAAREADEERARLRLQAFLAREQAARLTGAARRGSFVLGVSGVDEPQVGEVRSVQFAVAVDDADAGEMTG